MKPVVSVIIPMYNAALYIKECIMSLLNQNFTDFEIIVVDDGSTDNSYSLCKNEFSEEPKVRLFHQENKGVSGARTYGVREALGDYVFFVDADDTVKNDALDILYRKIIEGYDLVLSASPFEGEFSGKDFVQFVLEQKVPVCIWGKLIKKSFLTEQTMNLPSEINVGEDLALNLKLGLLINKVYFLLDNFYNYRYNPNSVMASRSITLDYEIKFHNLIKIILGNQMDAYHCSYKHLQLSSLEGLILAKVKINYHADWIKEILSCSHLLRLSRKEWVIVHIRQSFLCRMILLSFRKIISLIGIFK